VNFKSQVVSCLQIIIYAALKAPIGITILLSIICLAAQCNDDDSIPVCEKAPDHPVQYFHPTCNVRPHKFQYKVGDTITFFTNTSDQFLDSASMSRFDMSPFPLRPVHSLLKVDVWNGSHEYGYAILPFHVDSSYKPELLPPRKNDQVLRMWAIHNDSLGSFQAEVSFILSEPGKYISRWWDVYTVTKDNTFGDLTYADTIPLPDICEGHFFDIRSTFSDNDHFWRVLPEVTYIDTALSFSTFSLYQSVRRGQLPSGHPLWRGERSLESMGFFGFEVVE
jgi:hypothetical protein